MGAGRTCGDAVRRTRVRVTAPRLGTQQWSNETFGMGEGMKVIHLRPVGRLRGRVVEPTGMALSGVTLQIATIPRTVRGPYVGVVGATSDTQGRFEVPELPEGNLYIRIRPGRDRRTIKVPLEGRRIEGGRETGSSRAPPTIDR